MLLAFLGFICIFVSPLFLLMIYLLRSEMTAEITDDCCSGWMGAFLPFVIIPFFPDFQSSFPLMFHSDKRWGAEKKKKEKHAHVHFSIASGTFALSSGNVASFVVVMITE